MDVAGLVFGILSTLFGITGLGLILGVIGIPLSTISRSKLIKEKKPAGIATAGLILSIIGIVISVIFIPFILTTIITARNLSNNNSTGTAFNTTSNSNDALPKFDTFTLIGIMNTKTKDDHTVFIDMLIEYEPNNNEARNELNSKIYRLREFTRQYFTEKKYTELKNEDNVKQEMKETLNMEYLDIAKVRRVIFNKFYVMDF
jgi:flagellar basal body-associated protein FliL